MTAWQILKDYITSVRKERDRLKAVRDLEADVERRLKFQGLSREDRRAISRLTKAMRVHG